MSQLLQGILDLTPGMVLMFAIGGLLIWLAIAKEYEPTLLLPIGLGAILANIPHSAAIGTADEPGILTVLFDMGIRTELFPLLIFVAIGAMIDFGPLLQNPKMLLFGAAAQFGIFFTMCLAVVLQFTLKESASIGIIGAADGPLQLWWRIASLRIFWDQSPLPHILIWHWCPSFSRQLSVYSPHPANARFGWTTLASSPSLAERELYFPSRCH